MPLESQLKRTSGTVYGEIMRDSGVSLPEGKYISGNRFVAELINGVVVPRRSQQAMLIDLGRSLAMVLEIIF